MARFVLVHGGFSGAWIWLPLMDRLKADGHVVEAFDLPGMGDDHTSASEVSLDSYAGRVCEVLAADSEPAIVVGHSMGGIVATQGAARCPERVAALVYVAAFLPKDGQSLLDLTKLPEGDGEQVLANVVVEGEPPVAVMPPAASRLALYGSCAEDVAAWAIARQCPQPVSPLPMAVSIPPGALNGINRYYVLCTRDRAIPPPLQRRMVAENMCADVIELDTDHTPQLSMTNELAKALHRFATHSSAGARRLADSKDRAAEAASFPEKQEIRVKSLFDKLGGTKSIEAVVDEFYKRVLADTELKPFFAKTNMTWLRMRQVQFFTQALGGPALYKGKGMKEAHAKMTIGQHHFDLVAMHLVDTLKSLSVAQAEIDAVVSAVAPLAKDIVSK